MAVLGISGMQYSGETFPDVRIVLGEDSNVFTQMISQRLKELMGVDVEICRTFEDLQTDQRGRRRSRTQTGQCADRLGQRPDCSGPR